MNERTVILTENSKKNLEKLLDSRQSGLPPITLAALAAGTLEERWQHELQRVLDNLLDEDTDATKTREITIKVSISATSDRTQATVDTGVSSKIIGKSKVPAVFFLGKKSGRAVATLADPQLSFFEEKEQEQLN